MDTVPATSRSIWAIIGDIFFAPIQALEDFKLKPTWVVPLILSLILMAVAAGLPYKQNAQAQIDLLSTSTTLPGPALDAMKTAAQNPSPVSSIIGGVIVYTIISFIGALLAWVFGSFIFGKKTAYSHVWAVWLLTGLVPMLGGVIRSVLIVIKNNIDVSIGPAALLAGKDFTSFMYTVLYYTDIFAIWGVIVAGLGYAAIFGLPRGKGLTISIVIWVLGTLTMVGVQQFGLSFAGVETSFF
jgi:hypothetical protein